MSLAHKCDRCGTLYEPSAGAVHIERLGVASESVPSTYDCWDGVDLCPTCAKAVIDAVGEAIDRLPDFEVSAPFP